MCCCIIKLLRPLRQLKGKVANLMRLHDDVADLKATFDAYKDLDSANLGFGNAPAHAHLRKIKWGLFRFTLDILDFPRHALQQHLRSTKKLEDCVKKIEREPET